MLRLINKIISYIFMIFSIGILTIIFCGHASLKGRRPLLPFFFENLIINFGNFTLVNKTLKKPATASSFNKR